MSKSSNRHKIDVLKSWITSVVILKAKVKVSERSFKPENWNK
jgi:hypothetical protein